MGLDQAIERYHSAVDSFALGDPEPVKALYSHQDEATLANPFGPPVRGWRAVSDRLDYASSRFRDGRPIGFENLTLIAGADLASLLEIEHWEARVGEREEITPFVLRVTTVYFSFRPTLSLDTLGRRGSTAFHGSWPAVKRSGVRLP